MKYVYVAALAEVPTRKERFVAHFHAPANYVGKFFVSSVKGMLLAALDSSQRRPSFVHGVVNADNVDHAYQDGYSVIAVPEINKLQHDGRRWYLLNDYVFDASDVTGKDE